jgi:hypothetical protein
VIAYVFSHRPAAGVDVAEYEASLRGFHEQLAAARATGFINSCTYRVAERYDDWYLLEDSAALDSLNHISVKGEPGRAHDVLARVAAEGYGKLYKLAHGDPPAQPGFEIRLSKPVGTSYPDFYSHLDPWTREPGASLWRRQMVLGPPPEFCLVTEKSYELPADMDPHPFRRELV